MSKIRKGAIFTSALLSMFQVCYAEDSGFGRAHNHFSDAMTSTSANEQVDNNCLLPANIKDKGFKCDSVGDFGSGSKSFPDKTAVRYSGPNIMLLFSVGKEVTVRGFLVPKVRSTQDSEQLLMVPKFGDRPQLFRLINYGDTYPQSSALELTGKLQCCQPDAKTNADSTAKPAINHPYFFDCAQSKILKPNKLF